MKGENQTIESLEIGFPRSIGEKTPQNAKTHLVSPQQLVFGLKFFSIAGDALTQVLMDQSAGFFRSNVGRKLFE